MRGLILQPTYRVRGSGPVVQLYGRLEEGPGFLVEDDRFRPYLFVHTRDIDAVPRSDGVSIEITGGVDLMGEAVARVALEKPADVPAMRDRLRRAGARALEADLRFPYRYLIDHGLRAGVEIVGESRPAEGTDSGLLVFTNPTLRPSDVRPALRVLSIDIETPKDASAVWSVALAGCDSEEVHLVAPDPVAGAVSHEDEATLLAAVARRIRALDPDVITGWNVVDFDLTVLAARCRATGVLEAFGRVPGDMRFESDRGFTRQGRAEIPGRVVLDGIGIVRDALRLPDYRLETVAQSVLGRGKQIDHEAPDAAAEIARLYREDRPALVAYNLEDARLVLEILEKEGLLDLTLERSLLSGMPFDRVGASVASFDRLYLPELRKRGAVAGSVADVRGGGPIAGGAVLSSTPGLFRNVAVLDFKSLYPSLIRTFQLDPLAHARAAREGMDDPIIAPNGARFARGDAILPGLLDQFLASREEAKQRGARHADQAIKIMMNAFFGVLASPGCRFFDPDIANAITGFGQQTLGWTRDILEAEGLRVLYGDTDSVFVELRAVQSGEAAREEAEAVRSRVQERISVRIAEEYRVEPRLLLELEYVLDRFFLPRVRGGRGGSKKRYAGWRDENLLIVGLESVRRDWPAVSGRLQRGILERVFTDREVLPFVKEVVERVRAGELDEELVYVKRIRKGDVSSYTRTTPPHVQAARKVPDFRGGIIRYVVTRDGPEPVLPGRPLPEGIDHAHAEEKLLRPIADAILPEVGSSFDEAVGNPRQLSLL
ncbi:MAG: DNA polymerase II [Candidatus Binatia bacterium]|nr:DNA polymerase II [Candidatus Binatia bacterium]